MRGVSSKLGKLAEDCGFIADYTPTVHRRGWPTKSMKPFGLYSSEGKHIASFKTAEALERAIRARAGC